MISAQEFRYANLAQLGAWLRDGQATAVELATRSLELLGSTGRDLNAVVSVTAERALAEASVADAVDDHLVVARSFTKFFAIPGLRLGCLILPDAARAQALQPSWPVKGCSRARASCSSATTRPNGG